MKKRAILLAAGSVVILGLAILFITHVPQRLVDDLLYDNYNHYRSCEQLPLAAEVEKILADHADMVDQIKVISGEMSIEKRACGGAEHADIVIYYPGHAQRMQIEQLLGGKTFFGIPARWINW